MAIKIKSLGLGLIERILSWLHNQLSEKQFLILSSALVGLSAGIAAAILKAFVYLIHHYVVDQKIFTNGFKYIFVILPLIGIGLTVVIVRRFFKNKMDRGNAAILLSIAKKGSFLPFNQMYSHLLTSAVTVGFGGSAGLESPIVSTGSAIGSNYARTYKLNYKDRTLLLACGAAGGIAGAFNSPIAGVLFALEVLLVGINITAFIPLLIAAASGALISKIIFRENVLLYFRLQQPFDYHNLPFYIILGVLAGFLSVYYVNSFDKTEHFIAKINSPVKRLMIGGLLLGLLIAMFPSLFGEGYESIKNLANGNIKELFKDSVLEKYITGNWLIFICISAVMLLKAFATGLTLGSGGNGGNFAPTLFVGAYLGFAFSFILKMIGFKDIPVSNFTIVAMSGVLAGVFHAPLTGIFLIAEITGGYELMIPLMIVSASSYTLVKYFHPDSLDVIRLKKLGAYISEDKDKAILGKIEVEGMIEKNFTTLELDVKLGAIVEKIKHSSRNVFPVINKHNRLLGVILLDSIREEMFNQELYNKVIAKELMQKVDAKIDINTDDIFSIMKKFDESGQWNLPVVDNDKYVGFLSKSTILTKYRAELLNSY
ncbi:MAG: chloride channel protein [Bacteroidetes bacterium]|nr:chloride channel protein [Bacteroidota bacterium]